MRNIAIRLAFCLAVMTSLPASAEFRTINLAHEVPFINLGLPATVAGSMSFRACGDCELVTLRATPATRYTLNGEALELMDFAVALQQIRSRAIAADNVVTVLHNLETDTVLLIAVKL